jgi:penicillin-binding protein 2
MSIAANPRQWVIRAIFMLIALVILIKLLFLQVFEDKYKIMADDIAIYRKIKYPPRGVIYDAQGRVMLYNKTMYDLAVTPNEIKKDFDTLELCKAMEIDKASFEKRLVKARSKTGSNMRQGIFMEHLSAEQAARFQENMYLFPGFELVERSLRSYPHPYGGIFLGYIGEITAAMLKNTRYASYNQGDYVGLNGLERSYEEVLRGQRGVQFFERDKFNRPRDPYKKGLLDTPAIAGRSLELYIDAELQAYAERLMHNKLGSVVAIDPATGGILTMVSSPAYDPNLLNGADRKANFARLLNDATYPLFNRATQAAYQPGSTLKPFTALVALDVGAITPAYGYPCSGGYYLCGRRIGCTHTGGGHAANLRLALANSCNAYFCHIFRLAVDAARFRGVQKGLENWYHYYNSFGFGHPTGIDLPFEKGGLLPDTGFYNKMYRGDSWNSCTIVYVGMGQGEIALTPLQLANGICIIANKGFYYTPHLVRSIGKNPNDTLLRPFLEKHTVTHIPDSVFNTVGLGMMDVVNNGTGRIAKLNDLEVCAKTGTVENYAIVNGERMKMQNHSMFVAYAPRVNPRIAIAVTIENAGFGATWAGPIASLLIEKYLKDSVSAQRKGLEEKMMQANLISRYTYAIDSARKQKDRAIWERKMANRRYADSLQRAADSAAAMQLITDFIRKRGKK